MTDPRQLQVGFVVRAPLPNHPSRLRNALGRALVLTDPDEQDNTVCRLARLAVGSRSQVSFSTAFSTACENATNILQPDDTPSQSTPVVVTKNLLEKVTC
jgi:hypothetical protein